MSSSPIEPEMREHRPAAAMRPMEQGGAPPVRPDRVYAALVGPHGLRSGWSIGLFCLLVYFFAVFCGAVESMVLLDGFHLKLANSSPLSAIFGELQWVMAIAGAIALLARLGHRRFGDYYLSGPRSAANFLFGCVTGFGALSLLIGAMAAGGWLHLGSASLGPATIGRFAALWGVNFLLVGLAEEGSFRCYFQYTLANGINFWWALGIVGTMCAISLVFTHGQGVWGFYAFALAGMPPCLYAHKNKGARSAFWFAAWAGSAAFGFIHTFNNGENWIGIFAAAAVGFVFCVSVRLTGTAWWAIGCHAAWDWSETFFYGTADSGYTAQGHLFSATPAGSALWSGGSDGPEGSLLVLPIVLLLLLLLVLQYRRRRKSGSSNNPAE